MILQVRWMTAACRSLCVTSKENKDLWYGGNPPQEPPASAKGTETETSGGIWGATCPQRAWGNPRSESKQAPNLHPLMKEANNRILFVTGTFPGTIFIFITSNFEGFTAFDPNTFINRHEEQWRTFSSDNWQRCWLNWRARTKFQRQDWPPEDTGILRNRRILPGSSTSADSILQIPFCRCGGNSSS